MKKLKYIILLIVLLIPILGKAKNCELDKVSIKAVTIKNQSENVEELEKATLDNNQVNLNVKFQEKGDYITYNIFMQNNSDEDYEFYTDKFNINSDYVEYEIGSSDPIIKAGEGKIIEVKASYKNAVEQDKYLEGTYQDNKAINLRLLNNNEITNPETGMNHTIFSLICISLGCLIIWKTIKEPGTKKEAMLFIIAISIIIPTITKAACQYNLEINSNITIEQVKKICIIEGTGTCDNRIDGENIRKRELTEHDFNTYLDNINSLNIEHDFIRTEDIEKGIETKIPKDQIYDSSIGCYIFSSKKCN